MTYCESAGTPPARPLVNRRAAAFPSAVARPLIFLNASFPRR